MRLEARNVSFRYETGGREILKQMFFSVESGERVGIFAPSGYGKTTFLRLLAGYEKPDQGEVLLDGIPISRFKGRLPVQLIWQHPEQAVNPRWSMRKVLQEGSAWNEGEMAKVARRLGIREEWLDRFPSELSGGELQRFCIARALGGQTGILLADEMTAMMDLVAQRDVWQVVLEEAEARRLGIVLVSHSERLLSALCSRRVNPDLEGWNPENKWKK